MKIVRVLFSLVIMLALVSTASPVQASGPTGSWASGITCQNLDPTNSATVTLTFYQEGSGTAIAQTYTSTIPGGGSKNWFTLSGITMPGFPVFKGSGVVSSNLPLACNVNSQNTGTGTTENPYRVGTSAGFTTDQIADTIYIPQVIRSLVGWSTYVAVQNTSNTAATVNVKYYDGTGAEIGAAAESISIPGQSNHIFYQADNTNLPADAIYSMKIWAGDGTTKLAATSAMYQDGTSYDRTQFLSWNGFTVGAKKLFVPRFVRNLVGYQSGLTIMNIGTVATHVRVTFTFSGTNYVLETTTELQPNTSWVLYAPNITQLAPVELLPDGVQRQGSAVVEALNTDPNALLIAQVNEDNRVASGAQAWRKGHGTTYNAMIDGSQTTTIFFPQITDKAAGIWSGGFQIANTTTTAGTCDITYAGAPEAFENDVVLPASGQISRFGPSVPNLPDGFNAAVTVVCTQPITGIANLAATGKYGDSFSQSNGLNR